MLKLLMSNPWIILIAVASCFASGWTVRGWQEDSVDLAVQKATQAMDALQQQRESLTAKVVQDKLKGLKANERVTEIRLQEIINNNSHVYTLACIDSVGLDHINRVRP